MRSRFGRSGIYDIAVEVGDRLIAEFRGRSSEARGLRR
jgi:acyl-CoA thioesterase